MMIGLRAGELTEVQERDAWEVSCLRKLGFYSEDNLVFIEPQCIALTCLMFTSETSSHIISTGILFYTGIPT